MSKYNFELDIYSNNSTSILIDMIKAGSKVLEFGPAYGRLTKYLSENKKCVVHIVELDEEAGQIASAYAAKSCIGDSNGNINKFVWMNILGDEQYDYIVFEDVLEHLIDPENVLKKSSRLLKNSGSILISVPNIGHNAVILNLIDNKFQYHSVGLLDDTHIRFFTYKSLKEMINRVGLETVVERATFCGAEETELGATYESVDRETARFLRKRDFSDVYQFVFELKKKEYIFENQLLQDIKFDERKKYWYTIYFAENEYSELSENNIKKKYITPNIIQETIKCSFEHGIKVLRFDPLNSNCIVKLSSFVLYIDNRVIDLKPQISSNGKRALEDIYCFSTDDPQFYLKLEERISNFIIEIKLEFYEYDSNSISILEKMINAYNEKAERERETDQKKIAILNLESETYRKKALMINAEYETCKKQLLNCNAEYETCQKEKTNLKNMYEKLHSDYQHLQEMIVKQKDKMEKEYICVERQLLNMQDSYNVLLTSTCWKVTKPIRIIGDNMKKVILYFNSCKKLARKVVNNFKRIGIKGTTEKIIKMAPNAASYMATAVQVSDLSKNEDVWGEFITWLDNEEYNFIDIFHVPMGWNTPLFQRFQHLSLQAGNIGGIAIYGAHPLVDDIEIYKFENTKLCLVNLDNPNVKQKMFEILDKYDCFKYIRLQSIDLATTIEEIESYIAKGYKIVYEYIDEITPKITGSVPEFVLERHTYLLNNLDVTVIATSDKLYNQVMPYRNANMEMINNGVDYDHWNINKYNYPCPVELLEMVQKEKIVVGYHGALAQWIDYDLLKKIALDGRFVLLLIGHAHDNYMEKSGLLEIDNVYYIGAKPYKELNHYAAYYDIAILPFILNDITKSVSPVKIFEYMALKKPIVTYSLPECQKYESCLLADTQEEFLEQLNKALNLKNDDKYLKILEREALGNTWQAIAKRTVELAKGERGIAHD